MNNYVFIFVPISGYFSLHILFSSLGSFQECFVCFDGKVDRRLLYQLSTLS